MFSVNSYLQFLRTLLLIILSTTYSVPLLSFLKSFLVLNRPWLLSSTSGHPYWEQSVPIVGQMRTEETKACRVCLVSLKKGVTVKPIRSQNGSEGSFRSLVIPWVVERVLRGRGKGERMMEEQCKPKDNSMD